MSKKGKKKSGCKKNTLDKVLLATAITNLLIQIVELISKLFD